MSLNITMEAIDQSVCQYKLKQIIIDNIDDLVMRYLENPIDSDSLYDLLDENDKLSCEEFVTDHSESSVSVMFDEFLNEIPVSNLQEANNFLNDSIAINEEFNNYVDMLYSDGELGDQQVNQYVYVGKYSKD